MKNLFLIVYAIIAILVIALILLQGRGGGLGSAWGGGGETFTPDEEWKNLPLV